MKSFTQAVERQRDAVYQAIRRACDRLRKHGMADLADHFELSVQSASSSYVYAPQPRLTWDTD